MKKINVIWDMETGDPDDCITLLLLLGHPKVNLKAVTITPGTPDQIGLVRHIIYNIFKKDIPIGAYNKDHGKNCVSGWHYKVFGNVPQSTEAHSGPELLKELCDEDTTMITGGPLKNLGRAIKSDGFKLGRLVAQGGFAGEGVVPYELQLKKFCGFTTCATYNLNGAKQEALDVVATDLINEKYFVSKNVCHGVYYNQEMHNYFTKVKDKSLSLLYIHKAMDIYLTEHKNGKKFHDPLAACCAIDNSIGVWEQVDLYCNKGEWGAKLNYKSRTKIIIDYDRDKFIKTLTEYGEMK